MSLIYGIRFVFSVLALVGLISTGCGNAAMFHERRAHSIAGRVHPFASRPQESREYRTSVSGVYSPSSPGYVFRTFYSHAGAVVPYRQGNIRFGLVRVITTHDVATSLVGMTVENGILQRSSGGKETYVAWFYDPALPAGDPYRNATLRVVVSLRMMRDGRPKGIVSADASHDISRVPKWLRSPNPSNCAWGGGGPAP